MLVLHKSLHLGFYIDHLDAAVIAACSRSSSSGRSENEQRALWLPRGLSDAAFLDWFGQQRSDDGKFEESHPKNDAEKAGNRRSECPMPARGGHTGTDPELYAYLQV